MMRNKIWTVVVVLVVVVVAAVTGASTNRDVLHPNAIECKPDDVNKTELTCTLKQNKKYELDDFEWKNYEKVTIKGNKAKLHIQQPSNSIAMREVHVQNVSQLTTDKRKVKNHYIQLILQDCRDVTIEGGVDLVRMTSSVANKVILHQVSQFDLNNSTVGEVSLVIDSRQSIIQDSQIGLVSLLAVVGNFVFGMMNSKLDHVKRFEYNSSRDTILSNVRVGYVEPNGITFHQGNVNIENSTFDYVDQRGIGIMSEAKLNMISGEISIAAEDAIFVYPHGQVSMKSVMIEQNPNISFTLSDGSTEMYPLAFIKGPWIPSTGWIAIGVVGGLLVGSVTSSFMTHYVKKRLHSGHSAMDTNQLIKQEQPITTKERNPFPPPPPPTMTHALPTSIPPAVTRPLPDVPEDEYSDVLPPTFPMNMLQDKCSEGVPPNHLSPPNIASRQPHRSLKDRFRSKPNFVPQGIKTHKNDCRDILPPPPPPTDCEELYDDVDFIVSPPAPPPSTNKPTLSASGMPRKPAPPPAKRKPKGF